MIMSAEYESVFPMDIYPSYLIKAIITGDIDRQEALGIYEVAPRGFRSRGIRVLVETRVAAHRTRGTRFAP